MNVSCEELNVSSVSSACERMIGYVTEIEAEIREFCWTERWVLVLRTQLVMLGLQVMPAAVELVREISD